MAPVWVVLAFAVVVAAFGGKARASRGRNNPVSTVDEHTAALEMYSPVISTVAILHSVPAEFAMAWAAIESGGNAAAVGSPTATGPDGYPREIGWFQLYNPDDFKTLGAQPSELCAYAVRPGVGPRQRPDPSGDGGFLDGSERNPQRMSRPMTAAEQRRAAELGIGKITRAMHVAQTALASVGSTWSGADFWSAVKAVHAWPPIVHGWLAAVAKHLARGPSSWREFRSTLEQIEPSARFSQAIADAHGEQSNLYRGLENSEWVGFHVQPTEPVA